MTRLVSRRNDSEARVSKRQRGRREQRRQTHQHRTRARILAGTGLGVGAALGGGASAQAATFTVINLNDDGAGSLRQALLAANADATPDTIVFQSGLSGQITLSTGELVASQPVEILGP